MSIRLVSLGACSLLCSIAGCISHSNRLTDENAHPCGTQPVSKDATTNPSGGSCSVWPGFDECIPGRVEVLEAELKNALEQVKHFRDRISRARALHSIVEGTETFVTTTAGSWNSFLIIAYDEVLNFRTLARRSLMYMP